MQRFGRIPAKVLSHNVLVIGPLRDAMGVQFVAGARFVHLSEIRRRALLRIMLRPTGLDEPPVCAKRRPFL
jgi:hypothetical protein